MANKALINYYAKLLQRGSIQKEDIPEEMIKDVDKKMATLPPLEYDSVTQTPAAGQEKEETEAE